MSVDKYAVCPCGSGKKIKFCKCKESVAELDRVLKMVEGGQVVPALDRLATILQEHPDAAWALAIRGRLLLDLTEYDSLSENADRFIRLQPSNPLALTQRAAAKLFHGEVEQATESMLAALTECGRDVDAFVLDVSSVLAYSLAQRGVFLTARVYASLAMMASGYEGGQAAVSVLRQLNTSPTINQLIKAMPAPIERPIGCRVGRALRRSRYLAAQQQDRLGRIEVPVAATNTLLGTCRVVRAIDLRDMARRHESSVGTAEETLDLRITRRRKSRAFSRVIGLGGSRLAGDLSPGRHDGIRTGKHRRSRIEPDGRCPLRRTAVEPARLDADDRR